MSYTEKYLQAHGFFQDQSFEQFCSRIPKFYFRTQVPDDVIQNFEIVEKLMAFSYYEYKFIDEALTKAIHSFEMAMSIRYQELNLPPQKKKLVFDYLIKSLSKENRFDTSIEVLTEIKYLRNHFSHPERHSFGGVLYWNNIEFVTRLVNELYDDVTLRIERRKLASEFIANLKNYNLDHFVLMQTERNEPKILFNTSLLWINNKVSPHTFLLIYSPLFDLTFETDYQITNPEVFGLKIINSEFKGQSLTAIDAYTNETVRLDPIPENSIYMSLFQKWKSDYDSISWNFMYKNAIQMSSLQVLVPELQEFQKI